MWKIRLPGTARRCGPDPKSIDYHPREPYPACSGRGCRPAEASAYRWMQSNNTTWVLSRMAIEMDRYPDEYEHYQIETWVSDINRLMTTRDFILHDRAGNADRQRLYPLVDDRLQNTAAARPAHFGTLHGGGYRNRSADRPSGEDSQGKRHGHRNTPYPLQRHRFQPTYERSEIRAMDGRHAAARRVDFTTPAAPRYQLPA